MLRKHARHSRSLTMESLESRHLMAGLVAVDLHNGHLKITGDKHDNGVEIRQISAGQYRVTGLDQGGAPTLLRHGKTTVSEVLVKATPQSISIDLGSGNDRLVLQATGNLLNAFVVDDLMVRLGKGNDQLTARQVVVGDDMTVDLGSGNDTADLSSIVVGKSSGVDHDLLFEAGDGTDNIKIRQAEIRGDAGFRLGSKDSANTLEFGGKVADQLTIVGSDGSDNVHLRFWFAKTAVIQTGHGDDSVLLDSFGGSSLVRIDTGSGQDEVGVYGEQRIGTLPVDTGSGEDFVGIYDDPKIGELEVSLGHGNDWLSTGIMSSRQTAVIPSAKLDGGAGQDIFETYGGGLAFGLLTRVSFEINQAN